MACDHRRAPEYYTASVKRQCSWTAYPCSSYNDFESGKCLNCNGECPAMGYDADRTEKTGTYFLKTNSNTPFCGKSGVSALIPHLIIGECLFSTQVHARHYSYVRLRLVTNLQKAKLPALMQFA